MKRHIIVTIGIVRFTTCCNVHLSNVPVSILVAQEYFYMFAEFQLNVLKLDRACRCGCCSQDEPYFPTTDGLVCLGDFVYQTWHRASTVGLIKSRVFIRKNDWCLTTADIGKSFATLSLILKGLWFLYTISKVNHSPREPLWENSSIDLAAYSHWRFCPK